MTSSISLGEQGTDQKNSPFNWYKCLHSTPHTIYTFTVAWILKIIHMYTVKHDHTHPILSLQVSYISLYLHAFNLMNHFLLALYVHLVPLMCACYIQGGTGNLTVTTLSGAPLNIYSQWLLSMERSLLCTSFTCALILAPLIPCR